LSCNELRQTLPRQPSALNYFASLVAYGNVEAVLANIDAYSAHEILLAWVMVSQPISRGPTIPLVAVGPAGLRRIIDLETKITGSNHFKQPLDFHPALATKRYIPHESDQCPVEGASLRSVRYQGRNGEQIALDIGDI
jgi:hypothetical protein